MIRGRYIDAVTEDELKAATDVQYSNLQPRRPYGNESDNDSLKYLHGVGSRSLFRRCSSLELWQVLAGFDQPGAQPSARLWSSHVLRNAKERQP